MAACAAILLGLCQWRRKSDSLNVTFIRSSAILALAPLVFAIGFYLPMRINAASSDSGAENGAAMKPQDG